LAGLLLGGKFEIKFWNDCIEAISVVWNAVTNSSFAVRSSNKKENFQRVGWSLELPDD
jgi:hypothetical protein